MFEFSVKIFSLVYKSKIIKNVRVTNQLKVVRTNLAWFEIGVLWKPEQACIYICQLTSNMFSL